MFLLLRASAKSWLILTVSLSQWNLTDSIVNAPHTEYAAIKTRDNNIFFIVSNLFFCEFSIFLANKRFLFEERFFCGSYTVVLQRVVPDAVNFPEKSA